MMTTQSLPKETVRVLHGPSLLMGRGAVVIEFQDFLATPSDPAGVYKTLSDLGVPIAQEHFLEFNPRQEPVRGHQLVAVLARRIDARSSPGGKSVIAIAAAYRSGRCRVALSFLDPARSERILRAALGIARILSSHVRDPAPDIAVMRPRSESIRRLLDWGTVRPEFGQEYGMFMLAARRKGIPVTFLEGMPRVLLLGQGRHGRLLRATSNDRDSAIGTALAADKSLSNRIIERMGFPCVRHFVVNDERAAREAARRIGFPVVVKPVASGKGTGVFAGLTTEEECAAAYLEANRHSLRGVLVEGYVAGDDHRLAVFGGKLAWVVARRPAVVIGDGQKSIEALVAAENARRREIPPAERPFITAIDIDAEMLGHLAKSGLSPASVPVWGQQVVLRSIANVSKGGVYEDVSDRVHPDNREMAERVAAALRMDALGIDFITTDIGRSWREIGGAIIEVNETPAAGTAHYVDRVLDAMFPDGVDGRIPCMLFVNDHQGVAVANFLGKARVAGRVVGVVTSSSTEVNEHVRGRGDQSLDQRVQSLIIDPIVEIIAVRVTSEELEREGILLDRIDHAFIGEGLSDAVERLIRRHAVRVSMIPPAAGPHRSPGDA